MMHPTRRALFGSLALTLVLFTASCATSASAPDAGDPDAAAAVQLEGLVKPGSLSVGLTLPDAPYYITDDDNVPVRGITKDLLDAVADRLGLEVEYLPVAWEGGVSGVAAGRYDLFGGSLYDTLERQQAGTFVDFMREQATLITTKERADEFAADLDVCGETLAAIRGTTDTSYAEQLSDSCVEQGAEPLDITDYPTQQDAEVALESGRVDLGIQSVPAAHHAIEQGVNRAVVGEPFAGGFYVGSLLNSSKPEIIDAVLQAMTELYDDGTTAEIFADYGVEPVRPGVNLQTEG